MKEFKCRKYNRDFIQQNMMGPNSMMLLEELLENIPLTNDMRVLDLGCGKGLTSIFLAKEYGVQVFAVDLWIPASENYERFKEQGLEEQIIPIHADGTQLPFADNYFDAVISIDAYHYFGSNESYFDAYLAKLLKKDALIAIAIPGLKSEEIASIPEDMKPYWDKESFSTWKSAQWWTELLSKSDSIEVKKVQEMTCFHEAWQDWLETDNEYAIGDRAMIAADNDRYMNLVSIIGYKK